MPPEQNGGVKSGAGTDEERGRQFMQAFFLECMGGHGAAELRFRSESTSHECRKFSRECGESVVRASSGSFGCGTDWEVIYSLC